MKFLVAAGVVLLGNLASATMKSDELSAMFQSFAVDGEYGTPQGTNDSMGTHQILPRTACNYALDGQGKLCFRKYKYKDVKQVVKDNSDIMFADCVEDDFMRSNKKNGFKGYRVYALQTLKLNARAKLPYDWKCLYDQPDLGNGKTISNEKIHNCDEALGQIMVDKNHTWLRLSKLRDANGRKAKADLSKANFAYVLLLFAGSKDPANDAAYRESISTVIGPVSKAQKLATAQRLAADERKRRSEESF